MKQLRSLTRRRRAYTCLTIGTTLLATATIGIVADTANAVDEPGSGFLSLGLAAQAGGQRVIVSEEASGQPAGFAEADVPFAETTLNRVGGRAFASVSWPGSAAGNLGKFFTLLTGQNAPVPLDSPVRAEAQTGAGDSHVENNLPGGTMSADAVATRVAAKAQIGGSSNAGVGTFGTTKVNATSTMTGVTTAETEADSLAKDVRIVDTTGAALVRIGSVTSHAKATTDGKTAKAEGVTTVSDMSVAGIPVVVDKDGVKVRGSGIGTKAATEALNQALAETQTEIFVSEPHTTRDANGVTYDAGSLFISLGEGSLFVIIGGARVAAGGTLSTPFLLPSPPPVPSTSPGAVPPGQQVPPGTSTGGFVPPAGTTTGGAPAPTTAIPPTVFAGNPLSLPGGLAPGWVVLVVLGVGFLAGGLRWLPTKLLEETPTICPLGEQ